MLDERSGEKGGEHGSVPCEQLVYVCTFVPLACVPVCLCVAALL